MNTNLKSVYNICQLAHPLLKAAAAAPGAPHGGSVLINIGSVAGVTAIKSGASLMQRIIDGAWDLKAHPFLSFALSQGPSTP